MAELIFSTIGGFAFGVAATVGASLALWIADPRLRRSRMTQGIIAGIGAALPGLALFAFLGQTAAVGVGGSAVILAFVAVSAFTLMCIRSKPHTANRSRRRGLAASRNGIKL